MTLQLLTRVISGKAPMYHDLLEQQSAFDPTMSFRMLYYMVQLWESQREEMESQNVPLHQWRFRPILPVVFYTGRQTWESMSGMGQLMELPSELEQFIPRYNIVFFNLMTAPPEHLVQWDHPFGWILRVMQKEDATIEEFGAVLKQALNHIHNMPEDEKSNWSKLIYFILAFIYNRRERMEHDSLFGIVDDTISEKSRREEVKNMGKTIAEALIDEGKEIGIEIGKELGKELGKEIGKELGKELGKEIGAIAAKQEDLTKLLRAKFGITESLLKVIKSINKIEKLDKLFDCAITAKSIDEIEI